ncbi:MAG: 5'-deoxyadenosine deaminase [Candidatus Hydrogenedentes bacterium]|nr:5'-deoxyadenosine deaminase [Candidatus Hydrogenedentota bacterium]
MDLLITGGTVVTCDPQDRVVRGDLLVRDGRIAAIGQGGNFTTLPGARAVDARGCLILPGLVQAHVHLCQTLFRGFAEDLPLMDWLSERIWPYEGAHSADTLRASARLGIAELLLGGTTCALDMGTVHHQDAIFEAARDAGIRLTSGKAMMDKGQARPAGLRESTDESLRESDDLAARWHGAADGRLRYAFAPRFILSCSDALLKETARLARSRGCLLHTHASENPGELDAVRAATGKENIAALAERGLLGPDVVLAHCVWLSSEEQKLLRTTQTKVAHCPSTNLKLASGIAHVPELLEQGITVGLGADGAPCNNRLSQWSELRLAALLQKPRCGASAMPAKGVLRLATIEGARALGLDRDIGSLELGKKADLVVVDTRRPHLAPFSDPFAMLVYGAEAADVRDVFVEGEWLVRDRELVRWDTAEVLAAAEPAVDEVLERATGEKRKLKG